MTATELAHRIEELGREHGVEISASVHLDAAVYTSPPWTEYPDGMDAEVLEIATRRNGPNDYYLTPR